MPLSRKTKKPKHNRDISRLRNQCRGLPSNSDSTPHPTPPRSQAPSPEPAEVEEDEDLEIFNYFDSLKADFEQEIDNDYSDEEEVGEDMDELMELSSKDLAENMINMMLQDNPDLDDLDWIPERLGKKAAKWKKNTKGKSD